MELLIEMIQEYLDESRPHHKGIYKVVSVKETNDCNALIWLEGKSINTDEQTRFSDRIIIWNLLAWSHNKNKQNKSL